MVVLEEEEFEEYVSEETSGGEGGEEEGEPETINIPNVVYLEAMLDRLAVLEKLAKGEIEEKQAEQALASIIVPELESRRRRRKKSA